MEEPLLSVCLITYNHAVYIREAIDSVLMQQVDFSWELVIADDFSTDGTREILLDYKRKYPDFIKLILQDKNVGAAQNWLDLITSPKSKYIAYFEGDDYWTDPLKLQKQVNFLETNPDYVISFHRVYELTGEEKKISDLNISDKEETYTIKDLASGNFIHSPSIVYRNGLIKFPSWLTEAPAGDYVFHLLNARHGKIKYFPEPMAVYRRHAQSSWSSLHASKRYYNWLQVLMLLINEFSTEEETRKLLEKQLCDVYIAYMYEFEKNSNVDDLLSTNQMLFDKTNFFSSWWLQNVYKQQLKNISNFPIGVKSSFRHLFKSIGQKINRP